ncbi:hypothetical protein FWF74_00435 [Candidatus Saccharibacteria bacterium]|nr:hypothetical protein [Candidatus Saccharibacteria bacterium]
MSAEAPVNGMEQRYDNSAGAIAGYTQQANDYATLNMEHTTNATNYAAEAKKPNYTVEAKAAYANAATVSTSLAAKANQISLAYMAAVNAVRNGGNVDAAMKVVGDLCDEYSLLMVELNGIKFPVFKEKPTEEDRPKETTTEPTKPTEVVTTTTTTTTTQPPTTTNYPTTYPPGPNVPVKTDSEKERYQKIMSGAFGGAALMGAAGYALWASANRKEKRKIIAAINEAEGTGGSK